MECRPAATTRVPSRSLTGHDRKTPWIKPMTAPFKAIEGSADIAGLMLEIGRHAKAAARVLALAPAGQKDQALAAIAGAIRASRDDILAANAEDNAEAKADGATTAFL